MAHAWVIVSDQTPQIFQPVEFASAFRQTVWSGGPHSCCTCYGPASKSAIQKLIDLET